MNAERLLALYDQVADAPDAVDKLRRFVLAAAVRGKFSGQMAGDEDVASFIESLLQGRKHLVENKVIRKPRNHGDAHDSPFEIPEHWRWCRLDQVGAIVGGGTPKASEPDNFAAPGTGIPWLTPADLGGRRVKKIGVGSRDLSEKGLRSSSATLMPAGTVLFTSRAPIGYTAIAENAMATNQGFKSVVPFVPECARFIALVLTAFAPAINANAPGTTFKEVSGKAVAGIAFPLPPLAEQHRIVAKVDELMALCDRLEAARDTRETVRDRLTTATCTALTTTGAKQPGQPATDCAMQTFDALTARPRQIAKLRKTILDLAIRGKLTTQLANDEPARMLLERIDHERTRLLNDGYPNSTESKTQLKKQARQKMPENLSALPPGWEWSTLQACSLLVVDCKNKTAPYTESGTKLVRTTNIRNGQLNTNEQKYVNAETYRNWSLRCPPQAGDILITREAPMGEVCRIPEGETICLGQRLMLARVVPETMNPEFLLYSLRDPRLMDRVQDKPLGMTVQHLRVGGVETLLVPVPPLQEQHRIVAKVDELMALCDKLEASLQQADSQRTRLFDALLAEVLEPDVAVTEADRAYGCRHSRIVQRSVIGSYRRSPDFRTRLR